MKRSEDATTEFKRDYVDDIKKTVIAFANTSGGTFYIGIDDSGQTVGVGDVDRRFSTPLFIEITPSAPAH